MNLQPHHAIYPPAEGWEQHTLYLVEVSFRPSNPVHEAFLHVGFVHPMNDGMAIRPKDVWRYVDAATGEFAKNRLGSYCRVWCNNYDRDYDVSELHYLKVIRKLHTRGE